MLDTEILELIPTGEEELQSSEAVVGPSQDFAFSGNCATDFALPKITFTWHAWNDADGSPFPKDIVRSISLAEIRHWLQIFVQRRVRLASSFGIQRPRCPTGRVMPRGDYGPVGYVSANLLDCRP